MKFASRRLVLPGAQNAAYASAPGKIRPGPFFAMVSRNPVSVGDVGECDVALACLGMQVNIGGD
jgi:hypothetical protein